MTSTEYLEKYRSNLKIAVAMDVEDSIKKLISLINPNSEYQNSIYQILGQYNEVEKEGIKGIIESKEKDLKINKVRDRLFQLIDNLHYADLNDKEDKEFLQYKVEYLSAIPTPPITTPGSDSASKNTSVTPPTNSSSTPTKKTITDLSILVETNRTFLTIFPRVYRTLRGDIFRGSTNELDQKIQMVENALPTLHLFKEKMSQIEANTKKIRLSQDGTIYWLRINQMRDKMATLELDQLASVGNLVPDLETLFNNLKKKQLI